MSATNVALFEEISDVSLDLFLKRWRELLARNKLLAKYLHPYIYLLAKNNTKMSLEAQTKHYRESLGYSYS